VHYGVGISSQSNNGKGTLLLQPRWTDNVSGASETPVRDGANVKLIRLRALTGTEGGCAVTAYLACNDQWLNPVSSQTTNPANRLESSPPHEFSQSFASIREIRCSAQKTSREKSSPIPLGKSLFPIQTPNLSVTSGASGQA